MMSLVTSFKSCCFPPTNNLHRHRVRAGSHRNCKFLAFVTKSCENAAGVTQSITDSHIDIIETKVLANIKIVEGQLHIHSVRYLYIPLLVGFTGNGQGRWRFIEVSFSSLQAFVTDKGGTHPSCVRYKMNILKWLSIQITMLLTPTIMFNFRYSRIKGVAVSLLREFRRVLQFSSRHKNPAIFLNSLIRVEFMPLAIAIENSLFIDLSSDRLWHKGATAITYVVVMTMINST